LLRESSFSCLAFFDVKEAGCRDKDGHSTVEEIGGAGSWAGLAMGTSVVRSW